MYDEMLARHTLEFDLGIKQLHLSIDAVMDMVEKSIMARKLIVNKERFLAEAATDDDSGKDDVMLSGPMAISSHTIENESGTTTVEILGDMHGVHGDADCKGLATKNSTDAESANANNVMDKFLERLFDATTRPILVLCEMAMESSCRIKPKETVPASDHFLQSTRNMLRRCPHGNACNDASGRQRHGAAGQQPGFCDAIEVVPVDARMSSDGKNAFNLYNLEKHKNSALHAASIGDVRRFNRAVTSVLKAIDDSVFSPHVRPAVEDILAGNNEKNARRDSKLVESIDRRIAATILEIVDRESGLARCDKNSPVRVHIVKIISETTGKIGFALCMRAIVSFRSAYRAERSEPGSDDLALLTMIPQVIKAIIQLEDGIFWADSVLCDASILTNIFKPESTTINQGRVRTIFAIIGNTHAEFVRRYLAENGFSTTMQVHHEKNRVRCVNVNRWRPNPTAVQLRSEIASIAEAMVAVHGSRPTTARTASYAPDSIVMGRGEAVAASVAAAAASMALMAMANKWLNDR